MKLQEVFASEQNRIGNWDDIGYKDPSGGTGSSSGETQNFAYINLMSGEGIAAIGTWKASSIVGMNDCMIGTEWTITSSYESSSGNVIAAAGFAKNGDKCTISGLTPNFCKIGNSKTTGCN